jgi:hypothetical protein
MATANFKVKNGLTVGNLSLTASTGTISSNVGNITIFPVAGSNVLLTGNILPNANITYSSGSTTARWANVWATTFNGTATTAQYADLAEIYTSDYNYTAGTVVVLDGPAEITQSMHSHDTRIAGVISDKPAYLMNSEATGLPVALMGRVPCQVTGNITKGDRLVASYKPGHAMRLNPDLYEPGCIIGKALGDFTGESGTIEILVGRT